MKQFQKSLEQTKGVISDQNKPLAEDYRKAQSEISKIMDQIDATYRLESSCRRAAAAVPMSLEGEARQKAAAVIVAEATKGEPAFRYAAVEVLGGVDEPSVKEALRGLAGSDPDGGVRAMAVRALAELRDSESLPLLTGKCLKDEFWEVRASAIRALASIRSKEAVPILIAALENEAGRLQEDCEEVLENLSGKNFHGNAAAWKKWWGESQASFQLASAKPLGRRSAESEVPGQTVVSFYGIKTRSQRILFVLDISGSMNFGLGKKDYEYPNEGEPSRMEIARDELIRAIAAVPEGGFFNIITFATEVRVWQPGMVKSDDASRGKAKAFVEALEAVGGTNICGALARALEVVGLVTEHFSGAAVDTIYFLSDGKPTDGELTDPEKILEFVRQRNRIARIAIHTIGISGEADLTLLQKLAEENDGTFVSR